MKNEKLNNLSEEIRKIKYRIDYKINESPKYRPLVGNNEEFDSVPVLTNEAGEQEPPEKIGGGEQPQAPSNDLPNDANQPVDGTPTPTPVPAFDNNGATEEPMGNEQPVNPMDIEPQNQVDDIQNEIIKHNIEAMKSIHDQLEGLNATVQGLNSKLEALNTDVEEVREPTNTEKLMSKTNVSYPYYFNLNDFWKGNWFNEKRDKEIEKGIKELPDGTYVADFDELPQGSKSDVQNSFNSLI